MNRILCSMTNVTKSNGHAGGGLISLVIPAHNEAAGLAHIVERLAAVMADCRVEYEIIVVDDGSTDGTYETLVELAASRPRLKGIRFSRNFGKEAALLAGLRAASGDAAVTIDADLQHPVELIPVMLKHWRAGARVVHAVKTNRQADGFLTRMRAAMFNSLLSRLGGIEIRNSSDFKLLDRVALDVVTRDIGEHRRFYRGLVTWVGFQQVSIPFTVAERAAGNGRWRLLGLIDLASTAIVSFTSAPLRIVTFLGFFTLVFAFFVAAEALWSWAHGTAVSGFATIIITLLLLGSLIMISLGIMGEYIAKIYEEIKARPVYLVEGCHGLKQNAAATEPETATAAGAAEQP